MKIKPISTILILLFSMVYNAQGDTSKVSKDWRVFPSDKKTTMNQMTINTNPDLDFTKSGSSKVFQDSRIDRIGEQLRNKPFIYGKKL